METREIIYELNGESFQAQVQLLSPSAAIFIVRYGQEDPIHLEYNESRWEAIEEGQSAALVDSIGNALMNVYGSMIPRTVISDEQFFIMANESDEIICSWEGDLRIRVTASTEQLGLGDAQEKVYFGSCEDGFRAFQTIDFRAEDSDLIDQAIAWYTRRKPAAASSGNVPATAISLN